MNTYRKSLTIDPTTEYWYVDMGRLDRLNGPAKYPFPSEVAAIRFAKAHKLIAHLEYGVDREVSVLYPDGTRLEVLGDPDVKPV